MKTKEEPTPETSCVSNILQTMKNVYDNVYVPNQVMLQTFKELCNIVF
jgi:hypothetical protein